MALLRSQVALSIVLVAACEGSTPGGDGGLPDGRAGGDAGVVSPPDCDGLAPTPVVRLCEPLASDYSPGADDAWPACISDDGEYHPIEPSISTIARVMAYEEIRALLFDPSRDPSAQDFLDARLIYQRDEGLDSRVVRRYDPHYAAPAGTDCALDGVPEAYPDYCVGPARIAPILLDGFAAGIAGGDAMPPRAHAAQIEAALLWFLAVSTHKESLSCTSVAKDCDSSYAYYTGGEAARGGIGLAREVAAVDFGAHQRAWDGLLAVRCWRDLDPADTATDLAARELARAQYDRAVSDGVAAILRDRLVRACVTGETELVYQWAFARTLGAFLDRAVRERDPAQADLLAAELAHEDPSEADVTVAVAALDAAFDCP